MILLVWKFLFIYVRARSMDLNPQQWVYYREIINVQSSKTKSPALHKGSCITAISHTVILM